MAALRHGVSTVIIPAENMKDLEQIDPTVRRALNFVSAERIETVLNTALNHRKNLDPQILQSIPEKLKSKNSNSLIQQ